MVLSDLSYHNSQRSTRRALRRETEQPARASSSLSLRPEDSASNIGFAMQNAMVGWPQQYPAPAAPQTTFDRLRATSPWSPAPSTMAQPIPLPTHHPPPPSSVYSQPSAYPYPMPTTANQYTNAAPEIQQPQVSSNQPWLDHPQPPPPVAHSEVEIHPALRRTQTNTTASSATLINPSAAQTSASAAEDDGSWPTFHRDQFRALQATGQPVPDRLAYEAVLEGWQASIARRVDRLAAESAEDRRKRELGHRGRLKEWWAKNK